MSLPKDELDKSNKYAGPVIILNYYKIKVGNFIQFQPYKINILFFLIHMKVLTDSI